MTLNHVKVVRAVTFMKYLAKAVFLIFLPKTLISNKTTFSTLNSMNFAELVENELMKNISEKKLTIFLFLSKLLLLIVKILRAYN